MSTYNFPLQVAWQTLTLLINKKALVNTSGVAFYVWQRDDRIIVAFDPAAIVQPRVNDDFAHELSTILHGRRVIRTNSRGLFLQVGFEIPAAPKALTDGAQLDLTQQPTPWHLPIGMTKDGPLWISLLEGGSYLIGGTRGGGKTGEEHGWIQALLHGNKTVIYAWDGKRGVEFGRYVGHTNFNLIFNDVEGVKGLQEALVARERILALSGDPDIVTHNEQHPADFIPPIALFVDEAADLDPQAKEQLKSMIRLYRHVGLYPIIATNQPTQAEVFNKTNLATRIAFRVPHHNDSITMLGYKGAESLPDMRGRGLIVWKSNFVEFQSFVVTYPKPSEEARQALSEQLTTATTVTEPVKEKENPKAALKQKVIDAYLAYVNRNEEPNLSDIERTIYGSVRGGSYHNFIKKTIAEFEGTTTTTFPANGPALGLEGA
jgi:hypothetical protein